MIGLIQVVTRAQVEIDASIVGSIARGILLLVGMEKTDSMLNAEKLLDKVVNYRVFPDAAGKMNLSLRDINGGLLIVPQFTLVAKTQKGTRPGFSLGMSPDLGEKLFKDFIAYAESKHTPVGAGVFGAYMQVSLCNDGPVTFILNA